MVFLLMNVTKNSKFWTHKILTFKSTLSNLCPGVCGKVVFVGLPEKCVEIQRRTAKAKFRSSVKNKEGTSNINTSDHEQTRNQHT